MNTLYNRHILLAWVTGTTHYRLGHTPPNKELRLKRVVINDVDNGGAQCDVYYIQHGISYYLFTVTLTNADDYYDETLDILLPANVELWVRIVGATNGDAIHIYLYGEEYTLIRNGEL